MCPCVLLSYIKCYSISATFRNSKDKVGRNSDSRTPFSHSPPEKEGVKGEVLPHTLLPLPSGEGESEGGGTPTHPSWINLFIYSCNRNRKLPIATRLFFITRNSDGYILLWVRLFIPSKISNPPLAGSLGQEVKLSSTILRAARGDD